jgi:hypothetical protein
VLVFVCCGLPKTSESGNILEMQNTLAKYL